MQPNNEAHKERVLKNISNPTKNIFTPNKIAFKTLPADRTSIPTRLRLASTAENTGGKPVIGSSVFSPEKRAYPCPFFMFIAP
jgi:hypothetical protein